MLQKRENQGCRELLKRLDWHDALSLAKTTSGGMVVVSEDRNEAIDIILKFSESAEQLLWRKKLKRDILFVYLVDNGITPDISEGKHKLVERILNLWDVNKEDIVLDVVEKDTRTPPTTTQHGPIHNICGKDAEKTFAQVEKDTRTPPTTTQRGPIHDICGKDAKTFAQKLAEDFATWFYTMLNSLNPLMGKEEQDFGPQHFWDDGSIKLHCYTDSLFEEQFDGAMMVYHRLKDLVRKELLVFNPNLVDGVRGISEAHGLILVMVCGNVHQQNCWVGTFEQKFGLIQDPFMENNFKIKFTELTLRNTPREKRQAALETNELLAIAR